MLCFIIANLPAFWSVFVLNSCFIDCVLLFWMQAPGGPKGPDGDTGSKVWWSYKYASSRTPSAAASPSKSMNCKQKWMSNFCLLCLFPGRNRQTRNAWRERRCWCNGRWFCQYMRKTHNICIWSTSNDHVFLPLLQGHIGDPGPVGYSGMKVNCICTVPLTQHQQCLCASLCRTEWNEWDRTSSFQSLIFSSSNNDIHKGLK